MLSSVVLLLNTDVSQQLIESYLQGCWVPPLKTVPIERPSQHVGN